MENVGDPSDLVLSEDSAFLQALVANTTEGLLTIDAESKILFANPAIEDILGYPPDELIGSSKMKIIPERLRPVHGSALKQYLQTGEKHIDWTGVELPALHKAGHEVPVSVSLREHEYNGQRLFTGVFTDITERKEREQQLREQKRDLEEFAHVLSHDLRNPLAIAKGFADLIAEDYDIEEVTHLQQALSRIDQIIEDTADSALYGAVGEPPDVRSLYDTVQMAWNSVPTRDADLVLPDHSWNIRAHDGRLGQLLENLISNAIEHGGVDVTVRVGILGDGDGFFLEDDGPGIPEEVKTRLETPSGLSRERESGYGLQIVEKVVKEHGWEMEVTSSETGGARFEFPGAAVFQ